jgi:hypothetical protein
MATDYYVPSFVQVDASQADMVGRTIELALEQDNQSKGPITVLIPREDAENWLLVAQALLALGNDTDCIVTDPDVLEGD